MDTQGRCKAGAGRGPLQVGQPGLVQAEHSGQLGLQLPAGTHSRETWGDAEEHTLNLTLEAVGSSPAVPLPESLTFVQASVFLSMKHGLGIKH